jgi:outer membrane protein assembly factor BamB
MNALCRIVFVLIVNSAAVANALGQSFTQLIGGPLSHDAVGLIPQGGGWSVATRVFRGPSEGHRPVLIDCSTAGAVIAQNTLAIPGTVFLQAMTPANTSGSWICGSVMPEGGGRHRALVARLNASGQLQSYTAPNSVTDQQFLGIAALPDGGTVACGMVAGATGHDIVVARFAADGTMLWMSTEQTDTDTEAHALAVDATGILLTGRQVNFGGTSDALFMRYSLDGTLMWSTSWGGIEDEEGRALLRTVDGAFVMGGYTRSYGPVDLQGRRRKNLYLIKIDANGDTLWTRTHGDILKDREAFTIALATNGDLIVAGTVGAAGESDALAARFSANGQLLWEQRYDTGKEERILDLRAISDGFVACGWSFGAQGRQALLLRRNASGN